MMRAMPDSGSTTSYGKKGVEYIVVNPADVPTNDKERKNKK